MMLMKMMVTVMMIMMLMVAICQKNQLSYLRVPESSKVNGRGFDGELHY